MVRTVKGRRPYHSPRHAELRRRTRRSVVDAARGLFAERGYAATTVEAIAEAADVAVQTVYAAFGNKRAVLWALLETSVAGDDDPRTLQDRDDPRTLQDRLAGAVAGVEDPRARLRVVLRFGCAAIERSADVHRIVRGAAAGDDEIRAALDEGERRRRVDAAAFVDLVTAGRSAARQRRRAADVFYVVTSYEAYDLFVGRLGWTPASWLRWVEETLAAPLRLERTR
ncbi:MAG: TetR/AcrR family transcriptional regulator [Acidimicrobiia bacterium]|nr:TetR/AcrR family transcriptional regulator [Acidimicrobiia bacterium]